MSDKPRTYAGLSPDEIELLRNYDRMTSAQKRGMRLLLDLFKDPASDGNMKWVIRELEATAEMLCWIARFLKIRKNAPRERPDWLQLIKGGKTSCP